MDLFLLASLAILFLSASFFIAKRAMDACEEARFWRRQAEDILAEVKILEGVMRWRRRFLRRQKLSL